MRSFHEFIDHLHYSDYRPSTVDNYASDILAFERYLRENNIDPKQFTAADIKNFQTSLLNQPDATPRGKRSTRSVARTSSALRTFIRYQQQEGEELDFDHTAIALPIRSRVAAEQPTLSPDQIIRLLDLPLQFHTDPRVGVRNKAILELMLGGQMRPTDVLALNRSDVEDPTTITLHRKKAKVIYLTPRATRHLENYSRIPSASFTEPNTALFPPYRGGRHGSVGNRLTATHYTGMMNNYQQALGLDGYHLSRSLTHGLRAIDASTDRNSPTYRQLIFG